MLLTWFGQACFKVECIGEAENITLLTYPFPDGASGLQLPRHLSADVLAGSGEDNTGRFRSDEQAPLRITCPGEYEIKGVYIAALGSALTNPPNSLLLRIESEGLNFVHAGFLKTVPTEDAEWAFFENVDVLLLPVGGAGEVLSAKAAAEIVREVEPRLVVPMLYRFPGLKSNLEGVEPFLKFLGGQAETLPKLKLSRKDLLAQDLRVVVLEKN